MTSSSSPFSCPYPPAPPTGPLPESPSIASTISTLNLQRHIEGGYFIETDRNTTQIPNPFLNSNNNNNTTSTVQFVSSIAATATSSLTSDSPTRDTSTAIYYLLTPNSPIGYFHRNKGRTVHVHHRGRARYVIIHADEVTPGAGGGGNKARIETFIVGPNIEAGEKLQWIVEGGKFKASFLLPDDDSPPGDSSSCPSPPDAASSKGGCLITEVVTPGFEYPDHDFMTRDQLQELVGEDDFGVLARYLRRGERPTEEDLRTKITDRK